MVTDVGRPYDERRAEMAAATEYPNACSSHFALANLYLEPVFEKDV